MKGCLQKKYFEEFWDNIKIFIISTCILTTEITEIKNITFVHIETRFIIICDRLIYCLSINNP